MSFHNTTASGRSLERAKRALKSLPSLSSLSSSSPPPAGVSAADKAGAPPAGNGGALRPLPAQRPANQPSLASSHGSSILSHSQLAILQRDRCVAVTRLSSQPRLHRLAHAALRPRRPRALQHKLLPRSRGKVPRAPGRLNALLPPPWPASEPHYETWLLFLSILSIYSVFVTPFRLAFLPIGLFHHPLASFELFVDCVFLLNVVMMATCVLPDGLAEESRGRIALRYARSGRLGRDLVAALPLDFIAIACGLRSAPVIFGLGVQRMQRFR